MTPLAGEGSIPRNVIHRSPHADVAGEAPKAFVVLRADVTGAMPESLLDWVAERVAPHEKVRAVEAIDQIPRSASGKILRGLLVERERGHARA